MLILRFILSGFLFSVVRYAGIVTERMKYSLLNAQPSAVCFSHPSIGEPGGAIVEEHGQQLGNCGCRALTETQPQCTRHNQQLKNKKKCFHGLCR